MSIHDRATSGKPYKPALWEAAIDGPRVPENIDAERALLGALFVSNRSAELIPDLRADHFFHPLHGDIFDAIMAAFSVGRPVSATTLAPRFRDVRIDDATDGAQYLGSLIANATTTANVREYARTVMDAAQRRALIIVCLLYTSDAADE